MRVAVLGRTKMLYDTIECLQKAGHEIVVIGTCKAAPEYDINENDFRKRAHLLSIPFFCSADLDQQSIIEILEKVNADIAVSVNWLTIIRENILGIFRYGVLNAHCGDLPRYRGNACPNWAIIKGEKQFAISIHFMTEALDSGDIIKKEYYPITDATNITEIYKIAEAEIPKLFCSAIDDIEEGYMGSPQSTNPNDALRCYPRIPTDSIIDWHLSCEEIVRLIRASAAPLEGAYTFYGNIKLHILECVMKNYISPCYVCPGQVISVNKKNGQVEIAASDGIIEFDKVVVDGKEIIASDILKSTRIRLNYCLQEEIYLLRTQIEQLERQVRMLYVSQNKL